MIFSSSALRPPTRSSPASSASSPSSSNTLKLAAASSVSVSPRSADGSRFDGSDSDRSLRPSPESIGEPRGPWGPFPLTDPFVRASCRLSAWCACSGAPALIGSGSRNPLRKFSVASAPTSGREWSTWSGARPTNQSLRTLSRGTYSRLSSAWPRSLKKCTSPSYIGSKISVPSPDSLSSGDACTVDLWKAGQSPPALAPSSPSSTSR
mmetsp:Transcript_1836/g.6959  ORF Transcript_1836/g.6959 Transcript_1836/m.6959 type:complete len:208 (+) Transcript_1836:728-1351(+)